MLLIDKKISEFLNELKSDSPAPGGGSAAALAGAIGAALGVMVGNLTLNSANDATIHVEISQLMERLEEKLAKLKDYIDEDAQSFIEVVAAYKLPKSTESEKLLRSQAIQQGLQEASRLPINVAHICVEVLELSCKMLDIGSANAASDAAVAGRLAHAAMWSAVYNVKINLASITDQSFVVQMSKQVALVVLRSEELFTQLVSKADEKI